MIQYQKFLSKDEIAVFGNTLKTKLGHNSDNKRSKS